MIPVIYENITNSVRKKYIGMFSSGDALQPVYFQGNDAAELRAQMLLWLEQEQKKMGLTAELIEKRKQALAAARAARATKKAML